MSASGKQKEVKKSVHYVPSRYKQAAVKISNQPNLSKEKSIKINRDSQELQLSGNASQETSSISKLSTSGNSRGKTSTPTSKEVTFPLLDESAVTGADGYLTVPNLKQTIGPLSAGYVKRNLTKTFKSHDITQQSRHPVVTSYKEKKKNELYNEKIAEAELDILYTYYLQASFLESEAKKALEAKSSNAVEILHKLFTLVLQHLYKVKSQNSTLTILSSLIGIHEHCQRQEEILKPVFQVIPILEEQYKSVAEAINSTKHKLHVKDVIPPESGYEGDIVEILQKIREFIKAFLELLPNYKDVISSSVASSNYVDAGELMTEALKRGLSLLVEARDLCFSEASLALGYEN